LSKDSEIDCGKGALLFKKKNPLTTFVASGWLNVKLLLLDSNPAWIAKDLLINKRNFLFIVVLLFLLLIGE